MKNGHKHAINFASNKIKEIDRYSRIISFTYNDREEFGTVFGGLVSLVTYIVLAIYAYTLLKIMFEKNGTNNLFINKFKSNNNMV